MNERNETKFTAHYIGKCTVKGCDCRLHIDVPMIHQAWKETRHNHAARYSYTVPMSRDVLDKGGCRPDQLFLHCAAHKREIRWTPVNGKFSEAHVCDARCMNATGPNCECSCGGANHGRGHHVELKFSIK